VKISLLREIVVVAMKIIAEILVNAWSFYPQNAIELFGPATMILIAGFFLLIRGLFVLFMAA
jgi:hypothetical protein